LLKEAFGLSISEGTIYNILQKSTDAAKAAYEEIRVRLLQEGSVGADETGANVNGKLHWHWVFQSANLTYVFHHSSRGRKAIEAHSLTYLPKATLTTDRHSSYFGLQVGGHQLCLAHILRELTYLKELDSGQTWAGRMLELFREAIHKAKGATLGKIPIQALSERLDELLEESTSHLHEDFSRLRKSLLKYRDNIFTFLKKPEVPSDNNASERAIRKVKIKQKVSGCFRTEDGAKAFSVLHSIVETAKKNGNSKYKALLAVNSL
jgi:hypothetical protein